MSDTKQSMPSAKTTVQLEAPPDWAIEMSRRINEGFSALDARLDTVEQNVSILVDDKKVTNERLKRLEDWKENEVTARLSTQSERVRDASDVNLRQDAAIAQVITRVDGVEKKVDESLAILARLDAVAANPMVRRVAYAVGGAILAYLAGKGWLVR